MSQEIIAVLDKIAQYLGTTSEKVLEILTRMAFADAVVASILSIISIVLIIIISISTYKIIRWATLYEMDEENKNVLIFFIACVGGVFLILLMYFMYHSIIRLSGFFSPELWAYYELLPKLMK